MDQILEVVLGLSSIILASSGAIALLKLVNHKIENAVDEREERQLHERSALKHKHKLETIEKLETVASIVVADKDVSSILRSKIDEVYPRTRVEVSEDEEEPLTRRQRRKRQR